MVDRLGLAVALFVLAGCGALRKPPPPPDPSPPRAAPSQPRAATPRPTPPTPLATGKSYPECDPRAGDPDRGRVAMGLLAGDCEDERGQNAVYVTRFAPIGGGPSPAQQAGVLVGDRIVRLDTCEVPSTHELVQQLRTAVPGWVARLTVERGGREVEVFVPTVNLSGRGTPPGERHLSTAGCQAIGRKPAKEPASR